MQCINNIVSYMFQYITIATLEYNDLLSVEVILKRAGFRVEQQSNNTAH